MRLRLVAVWVCLGSWGPAWAQEQTATLVGVVRDASGAVIPGVSVRAANTGGLAVGSTTDGNGRYRFPALPPGTFDLVAELDGFTPAKVEGVELRLGQRFDIPIALRVAEVSESVDVTTETHLIAITQSARATSLRREEIEKLPNGRDFTDVVGQVAGANIERDVFPFGPVAIDGSSGSENRFIVDGAESTDLVFGVSTRPVVTDFLDEIQVKSSGYTPEFGGSTGGVINAITKSGGNDWRGDALLYWGADWLDAGNRPTLQLDPQDSTRAEHVVFPKDDYHAIEPGFTLGGPILRDRLWLFAGYLPRFEPIRRTAPFADGTPGTLLRHEKTQNAVASVSFQPGRDWRIRTSYNAGHVKEEGLLHEPNGTSDPNAAYDLVAVRPGWSLSASVDWIPSSSFYTSLRATYFRFDDNSEGVYEGDRVIWGTSSRDLPGVPPGDQRPTGFQNVPNNHAWDSQTGRLGIQWDSSFFFDAAGRHQLKAGVQLDRRSIDALIGPTGNIVVLRWDQPFAQQRGPFGHYLVVSNPVQPNRGGLVIGDARTDSLGLFVQDAWTIGDRLTLDLGLRTENENVPSFSRDPSIPETAIRFGFGDKLAPRLGFAWDATGDGRTKLYGSWGVFYDIMKLRGSARGMQFLSLFWYTLDDPDIAGIQDSDRCPPECPGRLIQHVDVETGSPINDPNNPDIRIDPGLDPMKLQEAVIGIERELAPSLTLSARYIHKHLDRAVEDVGFLTPEGNRYFTFANPGFGTTASFVPQGGTASLPYPRARRTYDAVEIGVRRRMADGWSGQLTYLWSRLWGNYSGLAFSDFPQNNPNVSTAFNSSIMSFDERGQPVYGLLSSDRTHQLKAHLVYEFGFGTTLGASAFGASGFPVSRFIQFDPAEDLEVFYLGRESDGRMPFTSRLDLQLQHRIPLGERLSLTLTATAFNVFDQGKPTTVWWQELFIGQAIDIPEAEFFSGFDTQQLIEEQGLVREPRFLMDRTFQAPRSIRLSARLSF